MWWSVMQKKIDSLSSVSRLQQGLDTIKIWLDLLIFLTTGLLATKLGLIVQHHKLECPVEKLDYVFKVKVTANVQNVSECLSEWYLLNRRTFRYQTWNGDAASWTRASCEENWLLSSRSRSQQGLMWSKYDYFFYFFWTADSLAAKLGLMIHHHKPECLVQKLDSCIQS